MSTHQSLRLPFRAAFALSAACLSTACVSGPRTAGRPPACCLTPGLRIAVEHRVSSIQTRRFTHEELWRALHPTVRLPQFRVEEIGKSIQGRALRAITFGEGSTAVLLWSQMHGDESTATMALADILGFLAEAQGDSLRERLRRALAITIVPMLNPDGAELFRRENALGVDINRDARRLATPEARALKTLHDRIKPAFALNLHDQGARTIAGEQGHQVAIALLAPASGPDRGYTPTRSRARLVASRIAEVLAGEIPGRIAKYDDAYNPRAFGDLLQRLGTSTVLIESGALPSDPEKQRLRALTVVAILSALDAIATRGYERADPARYERLPFNETIKNDLLLLGGRLVIGDQPPIGADLALVYSDPVARVGLRLREVGDLHGEVALDTIDVSGLFIHPAPAMLTTRGGLRWIRLDGPAAFTLRRGASGGSEIVRAFGTR